MEFGFLNCFPPLAKAVLFPFFFLNQQLVLKVIVLIYDLGIHSFVLEMRKFSHHSPFRSVHMNSTKYLSSGLFFFLPSKLFKPQKIDTVIDEYTCE